MQATLLRRFDSRNFVCVCVCVCNIFVSVGVGIFLLYTSSSRGYIFLLYTSLISWVYISAVHLPHIVGIYFCCTPPSFRRYISAIHLAHHCARPSQSSSRTILSKVSEMVSPLLEAQPSTISQIATSGYARRIRPSTCVCIGILDPSVRANICPFLHNPSCIDSRYAVKKTYSFNAKPLKYNRYSANINTSVDAHRHGIVAIAESNLGANGVRHLSEARERRGRGWVFISG